jgi:hypothetical protein
MSWTNFLSHKLGNNWDCKFHALMTKHFNMNKYSLFMNTLC